MTAPAAVIVNPSSGTAAPRDVLLRILRASVIDAEIAIATKGCDITALARQQFQNGCRTLVAAGGDGTVSAVAAAIVNTGATLGVLPLGTLNHFAKDLKLPLDLEGAVRNLRTGAVRAVDVAEVNGRAFVNNSGLSLYLSMVQEREECRRLAPREGMPCFDAAV